MGGEPALSFYSADRSSKVPKHIRPANKGCHLKIETSCRARLAVGALLLSSACVITDELGTEAGSSLRLDAASAYIHRGMVMNGDGVAQADLRTQVPVKSGGTVTLRGFANMDLSNSTAASGDETGWLPPGHAGKVSELDLSLAYEHQVERMLLGVGLISYVFPNGGEFPLTAGTFNGERGETKELFLRAQYDLDQVLPFIGVNLDFDEVYGEYISFGLSTRTYEPVEELELALTAQLSYSDARHSEWAYALPESGFSDARISADASYPLDEFTQVTAGLAYSTVVDSNLEEWFDFIGVESNNFWGAVGLRWSF